MFTNLPGSPSSAPLPFFRGTPKIDYRKKKRYLYSNLSTGGPSCLVSSVAIRSPVTFFSHACFIGLGPGRRTTTSLRSCPSREPSTASGTSRWARNKNSRQKGTPCVFCCVRRVKGVMCFVLLCCVVLCCVVLCCVVLCCVVLCCVVLCCVVLCCVVLCCVKSFVLLCSVVLCCVVVWCGVLCIFCCYVFFVVVLC